MSLETAKKLGLSASIMWLITPIILTVAYVSILFTLFSNLTFISSGAFPNSLGSFGLVFSGLIGLSVAVGVISLVALIFFLIGMYELSKYFSAPGIFRNIIYALIVGVVGSLATAGIFVALTFATIGGYLSSGVSPTSVVPAFGIGALVIFVVATLAIAVVVLMLFRCAFSKLADKSGVEQFRTAGILFLIGAFIPFVGSIISYVALVFTALGFHRLAPSQVSMSGYATSPYVTSSNGPVKRCLHCGTENSAEYQYCRTCGSPL